MLGIGLWIKRKNIKRLVPEFFVDVWASRFFRTLFFIAGLSHFIGVFVPETGFDAVWYHLPITQVLLNRGWDRFIPELYQSAMPHLGSLVFTLPYAMFGIVGVKFFTYLLAWLMIVLMYRIAKPLVGIRYALFGCLIFFTFHTVGWQASSAYVDSLRTVFELAAVSLIMENKNDINTTMMTSAMLESAMPFLGDKLTSKALNVK